MHTQKITTAKSNSLHSNEWPIVYRFVARLEDNFCEKVNNMLLQSLGDHINPNLCKGLEIELSRFEALERMEDTLSRWTQRLCGQIGDISIEVNNFGGKPPNLLFARITNTISLKKLNAQFGKLDFYLTGNGMPALQSSNRFLIPLLEKIEKQEFERIAYKLGRLEFHEMASIKVIYLQRISNGIWQNIRPYYLSI